MNEKLKQEALKRLNYLVKEKQLLPEVAKKLEKNDLKYYSDTMGILYLANEDGGMPEDIINKIKEIEEKYDVFVYHATHEFTGFGELYDLWCVTEEDLCDWRFDEFKSGITFAYVVNKSIPEFSEFGSIQYKVINGGCVRVA